MASALALLASHESAAQQIVIVTCANSLDVGYVWDGQVFQEAQKSASPNFTYTMSTDASEDGSTAYATMTTGAPAGFYRATHN